MQIIRNKVLISVLLSVILSSCGSRDKKIYVDIDSVEYKEFCIGKVCLGQKMDRVLDRFEESDYIFKCGDESIRDYNFLNTGRVVDFSISEKYGYVYDIIITIDNDQGQLKDIKELFLRDPNFKRSGIGYEGDYIKATELMSMLLIDHSAINVVERDKKGYYVLSSNYEKFLRGVKGPVKTYAK